MASDTEQGSAIAPTLPLSKSEEEVLRHYDRLQELKLEIALLRAQQSYSAGKQPSAPRPLMKRHGSLSRYQTRLQEMYRETKRRHFKPGHYIRLIRISSTTS